LHSLRKRSETKRLKNIARYYEDKEEEKTMVFLDSKKFIDVLEKHNRKCF
tara:strand:- start:1036 stop:1185 length:150 start_codon:yes stop_codon:yes gene_type:complete